jgi:recombination protein RecA|nr:MAG TPA: Protein recA [Caudoviricetes sp.]
MAKKSLAERLKMVDNISKKINEKAGKDIVGRVSKSEAMQEKLKAKFISTPSMNVNEAIGGGWPVGNISIVTGKEDSGKTAILLETIGKHHRENPDFVAIWLESEASLKERTLDMFGIDRERFILIEHDRDGAGEEAINRIEAYLAAGVADMVVINSLKCLVPSEEFKKDMNSLQVGAQSRMNAKMMRKITAIVEENEIAMVIVQHLTTQIGVMHGDPLTLSGGVAIKYGAMLIVDLRKLSIQESDPIKREDGVKIGVTVKKNHVVVDRFPYVKTQYYAIYGQGTEVYLEALDLAINQGILSKAGSFIRLPDENGEAKIINGEKMQWQGAARFRQYCMDNPLFFANIQSMIKGEIVNMSDEEVVEAKIEEEDIKKEMEEVLDPEDVIAIASKAKKKKK